MQYFKSSKSEYYLLSTLRGTTGAINCLAFVQDGKLLASGGDDQTVRIWDMDMFKAQQVICDQLERWGQITCIKWLSPTSDNGSVLCFGTGRGLILVYQTVADNFRELSNTSVFPFNNSVESLDYDKIKGRIVVSSHLGRIRVYTMEKNGTLIPVWQKELNEHPEGWRTIPRCVRFVRKGEDIIIFGLESRIMMSKLASTGADNWTKTLKSSVGAASFSIDESLLLVDNLVKGFDLYSYPRTSPSETFTIACEKTYIHDAVFLEKSNSIACGSDHGKLYLYSLDTTKLIQTLKHGSKTSMLQALDACSSSERHLIASGSNENKPNICIWEKKVMRQKSHSQWSCGCNLLLITVISNVLLMLFLGYAAADGRFFTELQIHPLKLQSTQSLNEQDIVNPLSSPSLAQVPQGEKRSKGLFF